MVYIYLLYIPDGVDKIRLELQSLNRMLEDRVPGLGARRVRSPGKGRLETARLGHQALPSKIVIHVYYIYKYTYCYLYIYIYIYIYIYVYLRAYIYIYIYIMY